MSDDMHEVLREAERRGAKILAKYGIRAPEHIRVRDIAQLEGAYVVEDELRGAVARLVRTNSGAVIRISSREQSEARKRFSIAHELGHYLLRHGSRPDLLCTEKDVFSEFHGKSEEAQANAFASELLLPRSMVEKRCDVSAVTLEPVRAIAHDFRASLTATAIKFVRLCPERCAVVFASSGMSRWFYKSEDFGAFIDMGGKVHHESLAYEFYVKRPIPPEAEEVPAHAWLADNHVRGIDEVVEHSVAIPSLDATLSVIWIRS